MVRPYGWRRDHHDERDFLFAAASSVLEALPAVVDLTPNCPPVFDQGALGACTAQAIAAALMFDQMRQQEAVWTPSRLMLYYDERVIEGTTGEDAGARLRDGIKTTAKTGLCPETLWPYEISRFAERPPQACYDAAVRFRALEYRRVPQSLDQLKGALAGGWPFVFGFTVYPGLEDAETARTGVVPLPQPGEQPLGGHAVLCVGYDTARVAFRFQNSWGADWGEAGRGWLPFRYLTNRRLASDFWVVRSVS